MSQPAERVKLYGLFPTTKRRYVAQVIAACVLLAVLLGVWVYYRANLRGRLDDLAHPALHLVIAFFDMVPWFVLAFAVLQALEAWFVFRAFARRKSAEPTPPPPPPQS